MNDGDIYNLLVIDFTLNGGDGYTMFRDNIVEHVTISKCSKLGLEEIIVKKYLKVST